MSVKLYDDALLAKFKTWTENTNIHVYGPDDSRRLFQVVADTTEDSPLQLPIISLCRIGGYSLRSTNKNPLSYDSVVIRSTDEYGRQLNAIPIEISYQIDVYTRYFQEADAYMRDIVFNIINHPIVTVQIPYLGEDKPHESKITVQSDIIDNSDIPERLVKGQFTRLSLNFTVEDAYLWDVRDRKNVTISDKSLNIDIRKDDVDYVIEHVSNTLEDKVK